MRNGTFWIAAAAVGIAFVVLSRVFFTNEYYFFAAYVVLQYIVLSTAWNILGGYTGYINFGTGAFFAIGAYSSVVLHKMPALTQAWFGIHTPAIPLPVMILVGGVVSGIVGLGTGYLTLRLRGVFFAIATLALAVVVQTLIVNWDYVGGSRGIYIIRPADAPLGGGYIQYLYTLMLALSVIAVGIARTIERSRLGLGFAAIRDDEQAAEAAGVPTLGLKLIATTLSGALMGMAGAPMPYYVTYLDPASSFNLAYAVNSVAMPVIGGMTSWIGPVIGSILLGTIQQLATVTISSALNLLIVGLLLIGFVIIAPNGIVGLVQARRRKRARAVEALAQQASAEAAETCLPCEPASNAPMPRITISYRRDDSGVITGRIFDRLVARYGREAIFRDIDDVPFGVDFRTHIDQVLASTDMVIAIVGPNWAGPSASQSRLSNESDPVRVEIETAFRRGTPLIPVLVLGAVMPSDTQLPESLKDFAYRNAVELDAGQNFDVGMGRLINALDGIVGLVQARWRASAAEAAAAAAQPKAGI